MIDVGQLLIGVFLIAAGTLQAINHPIVDKFNRTVKAGGTTQRPSDIEMTDFSILFGRLLGMLMIVAGSLVVNTAVNV